MEAPVYDRLYRYVIRNNRTGELTFCRDTRWFSSGWTIVAFVDYPTADYRSEEASAWLHLGMEKAGQIVGTAEPSGWPSTHPHKGDG